MERCSKQPPDRVVLPTSWPRVQIVDRHGLEDDDFPRETAGLDSRVYPANLQ
jgi:hypothetical protein